MKIQVLVATMNQKDRSLLEKMNIQSDTIVANQCYYDKVEYFTWNGNSIIYVNSNTKGVGKNRNNALEYANADICLIADDDLVYVNEYKNIIEDVFKRIPQADIVIFNLYEKGADRFITEQDSKVNRLNFGRFGAARLAIKLNSVLTHKIRFNEHFGGGTEHACGEDTIFLHDCLKKGLKIYAVPEFIAEIKSERPSTWFHGYDDKYFKDMGVLYRKLFPICWLPIIIVQILRHKKLYREYGLLKAIKQVCVCRK